jgi:2,3-bisphosphoglycerate-independent phosphoglycerate mutase
MGKTKIYERRDKFDIEFLWIQLEEVIEHGNEKDAKTKFELLQRIDQFLAKTMPKNKQRKEAISELTLSRKSVR